jgi:hypothetical protein
LFGSQPEIAPAKENEPGPAHTPVQRLSWINRVANSITRRSSQIVVDDAELPPPEQRRILSPEQAAEPAPTPLLSHEEAFGNTLSPVQSKQARVSGSKRSRCQVTANKKLSESTHASPTKTAQVDTVPLTPAQSKASPLRVVSSKASPSPVKISPTKQIDFSENIMAMTVAQLKEFIAVRKGTFEKTAKKAQLQQVALSLANASSNVHRSRTASRSPAKLSAEKRKRSISPAAGNNAFLTKKTVAELKAIARSLNIEVPPKILKFDLMQLIGKHL